MAGTLARDIGRTVVPARRSVAEVPPDAADSPAFLITFPTLATAFDTVDTTAPTTRAGDDALADDMVASLTME